MHTLFNSFIRKLNLPTIMIESIIELNRICFEAESEQEQKTDEQTPSNAGEPNKQGDQPAEQEAQPKQQSEQPSSQDAQPKPQENTPEQKVDDKEKTQKPSTQDSNELISGASINEAAVIKLFDNYTAECRNKLNNAIKENFGENVVNSIQQKVEELKSSEDPVDPKVFGELMLKVEGLDDAKKAKIGHYANNVIKYNLLPHGLQPKDTPTSIVAPSDEIEEQDYTEETDNQPSGTNETTEPTQGTQEEGKK